MTQAERVKRYREKNKEKISLKSKKKYRSDSNRYIYMMLQRAKCRAKKRGIPFNLTESDIIIPECCPVLGIKLEIGDEKGPKDSSPSLDKIIPELGYTKDNIVVMSYRANRIKSNATVEEISKVLDWFNNQKTK